jgi:hypothetical protein
MNGTPLRMKVPTPDGFQLAIELPSTSASHNVNIFHEINPLDWQLAYSS